MSQQPSNFLGGSGYRPQPTPPLQTYEPRNVPRGPANTAAVLSVSSAGRCTLSKPLLAAADLSGGRPVRLVVPRLRGGNFYLDTSPRPGDGTRLPTHGPAVFRVGNIPLMHFQESRPAVPGFVLCSITNSFKALLHFRLGPEVEGHPGYYHLLPGL